MSFAPSIPSGIILRPSHHIFKSIFGKNSNGEYTSDALLEQDILVYALYREGRDFPFRFQTLVKWLLQNNQEYVSLYSSGSRNRMTESSKIANISNRVQKHLAKLKVRGLIDEVGKVPSERNKKIKTPLFQYTLPGLTLAHLIRYNHKRYQNTEKEKSDFETAILKLTIQYLQTGNNYTQLFTARLISKAIELGFRRSLVVHVLKLIDENEESITLSEAVSDSIDMHLDKKPYRRGFAKVWIGALEESEEVARKFIIYVHKYNLEGEILSANPPKAYQELWIENVANITQLALYGKCEKCKSSYPIKVNYFRYIEEASRWGYARMTCFQCKGLLQVFPEIPD